VVGVLILLLGVAGAWVWQNPGFVQTTLRSVFPGSARHDTEADAIQALDARVTRLEQRPPADLGQFTQRLDALEQSLPPTGPPTEQPGGQSGASRADLRTVIARLDALEANSRQAAMARQSMPTQSNTRPVETPPAAEATPTQDLLTQTPANAAPGSTILGNPSEGTFGQGSRAAQSSVPAELRSLLARLDAMEKQQAAHAGDPAKVDALAAKVDQLAGADPAAEVRGQLEDVQRRLSELTAGETKLADTSDHVTRLAQLEAAEIALASGRPLGAIPDAPPALTRFAATAPPTEAGLRLAFRPAAQASVKVSQPDTEGKPFLDRVMARLEDSRLITVREGDHVVLGNSAAETLARAQVLLDAGDLDGAVRTVATLTGPPAEKMAQWLANAKALQAAREALASLAENG
jgi:hypothetical protein